MLWWSDFPTNSNAGNAVAQASWGKSGCVCKCWFPNTGVLNPTSGDAPLETRYLLVNLATLVPNSVVFWAMSPYKTLKNASTKSSLCLPIYHSWLLLLLPLPSPPPQSLLPLSPPHLLLFLLPELHDSSLPSPPEYVIKCSTLPQVNLITAETNMTAT